MLPQLLLQLLQCCFLILVDDVVDLVDIYTSKAFILDHDFKHHSLAPLYFNTQYSFAGDVPMLAC